MRPKILDRLQIFGVENRGHLLDLTVFLTNLFLLRLLSRLFQRILKAGLDGDLIARSAVMLMLVGMFALPPIGATLKRWHFHKRRDPEKGEMPISWLFNPIFYFCLAVVIFAFVNSLVMEFLGLNRGPHGVYFGVSLGVGIVLIFVNTFLVYRYFIAPKKTPTSPFLLSSRSEFIGDLCIWVNVMLFQLFWNLLALIPQGAPGSFGEFCVRLFLFGFLALLLYFPPRIFYLAEDMKKRGTWLFIALANLPLVARVVFGV
ncbi:MAG: hypothetical protein QM785_00530 [Pyrinomonadaceae bacterium]